MNPVSPLSHQALLNAITAVLSHYITETDPYILFDGLLTSLLEMTDSEYGFIGEIFHDDNQQPYIQCYATTNIAWSLATRQLYAKNKQKGMRFSRLDSLYGTVLKTGQLVIANQPETDPRGCGRPEGHPALRSFMGIPFYGGGKMVGVVGMANRQQGYQHTIAEALHPFLITCGNLIQAYQNNQRHQQVAEELRHYKAQLAGKTEIILDTSYCLVQEPVNLLRNGEQVLLTKKETRLLEILAQNRNRLVANAVIEAHVWGDIVVGESSLRSLVRRLRPKLPGLTIKTVQGLGYMLLAAA